MSSYCRRQRTSLATAQRHGAVHPVLRMLAEDRLETHEIVIEPEEVQAQPDSWKKISEERTSQLDRVAPKIIKRVFIRPRYVNAERFAIAPLPPQPIEQGMVGPGLLAQILVSKYAAYESLAKARDDLTLVGCWAHARRGFHEALAETKLAAWFVHQIGHLYAVEKELREQEAGPALRQAMRVWQSQPVLARLHRAMELIGRRALPQGLIGQAIDYTLKRWEALTRFVDDGVLEIDNNLIENLIRPSALGKKNFLFIGHPGAGERSAVIYTLLGSCRRHGVNPFDYLKDLFTRPPGAKITEIQQFTPALWAEAKEQVIAQAA